MIFTSPVFCYDTGKEKCGFLTVEPAVMEFLLYHFVQVGKRALHYAAWNGHEQVVQTLLKMDADVNATGKVCD